MSNVGNRWATGSVQRRIGVAMVALSLAGMLIAGIWLSADAFAGLAHWSGVVLVQCVYAALIAYLVYTILRRKLAVSFTFIFGILLVGSFAYHVPSAYIDNSRRVDADHIILAVRQGSREIADLSPAERSNPYVGAFLVMRDVSRQLYERADARVSPYRAAYADSVRTGAFLDPHRLDTAYEIWYSYAQLHQLEQILRRAIDSRLDVSDLLWTANMLGVDAGTRAAYTNELRASAGAIDKAQAASLEQELETLAQTKQSLEVLIAAEGHYRIEGSQIVFDEPDLHDRFRGKSGGSSAH